MEIDIHGKITAKTLVKWLDRVIKDQGYESMYEALCTLRDLLSNLED